MLSTYFLHQSSLRGTILCAATSKSYKISTNYHACIVMLTWCRCDLLFLFWTWHLFNLFPRSCLTWILFINIYWWIPLCVQHPAKARTFQQFIMHVLQCRCAPPVLFWNWPQFNMFPRSCFTQIFFINLHWGVPLCVQYPAKAITFQQIIDHV